MATLLDLLTQPEELENARTEFNERTGGGVGGSKWVAPLLASDFPPPVDLRWPEYVQTARRGVVDSDAGYRLGRRRTALTMKPATLLSRCAQSLAGVFAFSKRLVYKLSAK